MERHAGIHAVRLKLNSLGILWSSSEPQPRACDREVTRRKDTTEVDLNFDKKDECVQGHGGCIQVQEPCDVG